MDPYVWSQASLDQLQYEVASQDDISPLWVHTTDNDSWGWGEMGSEDYFPQHTIFASPILQSPTSYDFVTSSHASSYQSSQSDESPRERSVDDDSATDPKLLGRPRAPDVSSRNPNENRVQRRRTQNRNSQRVYRQRRIDERNMFETRALTAEEDAQDLRNQVGELQTQVVELKGRVGELEDENHSLRSGQARK